MNTSLARLSQLPAGESGVHLTAARAQEARVQPPVPRIHRAVIAVVAITVWYASQSLLESRGFPGGTAYVASKFALGGMTECWRAELRKHEVRVMQINPSEVLTDFSSAAGYDQKRSEKKLRSREIAHAILGMLSMDDRGFTTELTVFATNPDGA